MKLYFILILSFFLLHNLSYANKKKGKRFSFIVIQKKGDSSKFTKLIDKFQNKYSFETGIFIQGGSKYSKSLCLKRSQVTFISSIYYRTILFTKDVTHKDYKISYVQYNNERKRRITLY